jgi:hypothetical protein
VWRTLMQGCCNKQQNHSCFINRWQPLFLHHLGFNLDQRNASRQHGVSINVFPATFPLSSPIQLIQSHEHFRGLALPTISAAPIIDHIFFYSLVPTTLLATTFSSSGRWLAQLACLKGLQETLRAILMYLPNYLPKGTWKG